MELVRQKNAATYITFPIVDADGDFVSGATALDSEIDAWTDGAAPDGFADCTNEATEIGTTGIYYLSLTQTEMNNDYIVIQVKTTSSGAKTQMILINTMVGDPLNRATTTSGRELDVSAGGEAGVDWANVGSPTTSVNLSGTTTNLVNTVTTYTGNTPQTGDSYARLGAPTGASVSADIATIDDFLDTEVAAILAAVDTEVAAILALLDDPRGEPGQGAPGVSVDLATKVDYLYKGFRNKQTQTSTTWSLFADDATTVDQKATVSDDTTTFTRGEIATGP